jgi:hypothetical protein
MEDTWIFKCPHCGGSVSVAKSQINCKIFRHAMLKSDGTQVSPHASRSVCDALVASDSIWGCGKPFAFDGVTVAVCSWNS